MQFKGGSSADEDEDVPDKGQFSFVELVRRIQSNAKRYMDVVSAAADFCLEELGKEATDRGEPPVVAAGTSVAVDSAGNPLATQTTDIFDVLYK
jgi:hypothetical protein